MRTPGYCRCGAAAEAARWLVAAAGIWLAACTSPWSVRSPATVHIEGSDTMLQLTTRWSEEYMREHPDVAVSVAGGGSAAGVAALLAGQADLAAVSRPLLSDEVQALYVRFGTLGVVHLCARDGLSVYLHPDNPVRDLSMLQLKGLFTGRIGWWAKVGGVEEAVHVVIRQPSSGTYRLFQDLVLLDEPYSARATAVPTTAAVVDLVSRNRAAVGYGGIALGSHLVHCRIDGVPPTPETVADGSYPLTRYLSLVSRRPPDGPTKELVDWVLSPAGQAVVKEVGFIPLWEAPPSH